jgi:hypothetical protein
MGNCKFRLAGAELQIPLSRAVFIAELQPNRPGR